VDETGSPDPEVVDFVGRFHPGGRVWLRLPKVRNPIAADLLVLLSASRDITFVDLETEDVEGTWEAFRMLRDRLSVHTGPGYASQSTAVKGSEGYRLDIGMIHLLDDETMEQDLVLVPTVADAAKETLRVELGTLDVTNPSAFLLPLGPEIPLEKKTGQREGGTVIHVPYEGPPVLLSFERLKTGSVGYDEISVEEEYRLPVEFILARHHAVVQAQDVLMSNYTARARVDYHFKIPGGGGPWTSPSSTPSSSSGESDPCGFRRSS